VELEETLWLLFLAGWKLYLFCDVMEI
jgi:hypothetical protein